LGRLHRNKGFDILLEALANVPYLHLVLAGDGPERAALEREIARLRLKPRVHLIGWRDDTAALMAAADLVVLPSRHEPLGNVVIEAWAHGVPIVAAAASGPASLIRPGENGWLVPIEDAAALAAAIRTVLAGRPTPVIEAGYADYQRLYSETVVVAAYRDLFQRIAA
jgi:glycosyltransferase involved in cell wall biosynthesis